MQYYILSVLILFSSSQLFASGASDRGGGAILRCQTAPEIRLLDYYVGESQLGSFPQERIGSVEEILSRDLDYLGSIDAGRAALYRVIISKMLDQMQLIDQKLSLSQDVGVLPIPSGCEIETVVLQRTDEYVNLGYKRYLVNRAAWNSLDASNKAGLILHEAIYREMLFYGATSAFPTQDFNLRIANRILPQGEEFKRLVGWVYRLPYRTVSGIGYSWDRNVQRHLSVLQGQLVGSQNWEGENYSIIRSLKIFPLVKKESITIHLSNGKKFELSSHMMFPFYPTQPDLVNYIDFQESLKSPRDYPQFTDNDQVISYGEGPLSQLFLPMLASTTYRISLSSPRKCSGESKSIYLQSESLRSFDAETPKLKYEILRKDGSRHPVFVEKEEPFNCLEDILEVSSTRDVMLVDLSYILYM